MAIHTFDNIEDFFDEERKQRETADASVKDWQRAIKPGDYFRQRHEVGINIYGEVLEDDEPRGPGLENYRFCRAYSLACPEGELGDIHVSQIEEILTRAKFEVAKARGWR